jgi:transcriptional regulator with XRE-family HTH domain
MKKQKSLRQLAKELEVSPSYLSMILSGQRKCPEKLQGSLFSFTNVHKSKLKGAWKAGTLPTELLPHT